MARFHGTVGFAEQTEVAPDVWESANITRRYYYGDILRSQKTFAATSSSTNDDVKVSNQISLISDSYMRSHIDAIRFVIFAGTPWKVTTVEIDDKRIIVTLGEVYNGLVE